jgi:hypothetical protein
MDLISSAKLKGYVVVNHSNITKGELTIKSTNYNRGHSLRIQIDPGHPVELGQVFAIDKMKMVHNCLSMASTLAARLEPSLIHVMIHVLRID